MSVLDRAALDESPLADLHTIASELSIDGYRRLRRQELIDAIVARQSGEASPQDDLVDAGATEPQEEEDRAGPRRRRGRRGGRGRGAGRAEAESADQEGDQRKNTAADEVKTAEDEAGAQTDEPRPDERIVVGVVELLPNGSGFVRLSPPGPSDDDVYVSAAQVKRCELVGGDRISGPLRAPRRAERFPSLIRIDTINDKPADEIAEGTRFDDLPVAFPGERLELGSQDATLEAIESLTPFGKGSRVTIVGAARAGKTETLRRIAGALSQREDLELFLVLAGVRPEEIAESDKGPVAPTASASFAASADSQAHTVERVIDQARRIAARGANAVVLIDTLEGLHPPAARKTLAAARNIVDGGSLTLIATAAKPFGGETTVIALDADLARTGRFPALDVLASGTIRVELLVGEDGAKEIAKARAQAAGS